MNLIDWEKYRTVIWVYGCDVPLFIFLSKECVIKVKIFFILFYSDVESWVPVVGK